MYTIQTSNLTKIYNQGQPNEVASVRGVDLQLPAGSCTLLKGPSGSGKTTLLMLLGCLARPTEGSYNCLGQQVSRWSEKHLTRFRKQHIGIVFQRFHLIQGLSVAENIALPLLPQGLSGKALRQAAAQAAEQVHIAHRLDFAVDRLSGGEMQRVAIARALVSSPDILLADEPTSQLDTDNSLSVLSIFQELVAQGKTLVLTTHDPLVEQHLPVRQVVQMKDGRVLEG